ncbi:MAG: glycosyltransferase [Pyrinomonadaceae bacterium]
MKQPVIAILIPCYNEELTVAGVVEEFRAQLPGAQVYVYDNNSSDGTAEVASAAGATVRRERRQGKGYVVQAMFRQIDADVYVMVDGDGTYPAAAVHALVAPVVRGEADQVLGSRLHARSQSEFRSINRFGNRLIRAALRWAFRVNVTDVLSGYRAFNRRFVKSLPLFGGGFEIETELTIKAAARGYRIMEVPVNLTSRPAGSRSKINLFRDGFLILNTILTLLRDYKPLTFFGVAGVLLFAAALAPGVAAAWLPEAARGTRLTSMIVAALLSLGGMLSITVGLILHTLARRSQEFEHHISVLLDEINEGRGGTRGDGEIDE